MYISRRSILVVGLLVITFIAAGAVYADDGNTIHGCVNPSGVLRVVEPPEECRESETILNWNLVGPTGPQGPQGEQGLPGEQGPPGVVGFYTDELAASCLAGENCSVEIACSAGDEVVGGGYVLPAVEGIWVFYNGPKGDASWEVAIKNNFGGTYIVWTTIVRCADLTP